MEQGFNLNPLWVILGVLVLLFFYLVMFLLPDDAYGEEDVRTFSEEKIKSRYRTHVVVLGDIGRSPRMQNHALALARRSAAVNLIGYTDSEMHPEIAGKVHKDLTVHSLYKSPPWLNTSSPALFLVTAPLKALWQFWSLWWILSHEVKPARSMIVQNPPSIPTLAVCAMICWLRKTQLIIDWHNTGYSILALKLGQNHLLVQLAKAYEKYYAGSAKINLTVSDAMRRQLKRDFDIKAPLLRLYDRPTSDFHLATPDERLSFLGDMELPDAQQSALENGKLKVLVSSTSWTADEDFSILLDSLVEYSKLATTSNTSLPELLVIITGKGPQKAFYTRKIDELEKTGKLKKVDIKTAWLPTAAYAMLLASADIGVSLHKSSSGVDLPMKVVDMFGAGLPVVGYSLYESWSELVKEGVNGRGFGTSEELTSILVQLLGGDGSKLSALKEAVRKERDNDWDTEWASCAGEVLGLNERPSAEEMNKTYDALTQTQKLAESRNLHFGTKPAHATDASDYKGPNKERESIDCKNKEIAR